MIQFYFCHIQIFIQTLVKILYLIVSMIFKLSMVPIIYAQQVKGSTKRKIGIFMGALCIFRLETRAFPSTCWLIPARPRSISSRRTLQPSLSLHGCNKTLSVSASPLEIATLRFPGLKKPRRLSLYLQNSETKNITRALIYEFSMSFKIRTDHIWNQRTIFW